jgi:hypothetical protein
LKLIDFLQFLAHAAQGTVQSRLGGSKWNAERSRGIGQLKILTKAKCQ